MHLYFQKPVFSHILTPRCHAPRELTAPRGALFPRWSTLPNLLPGYRKVGFPVANRGEQGQLNPNATRLRCANGFTTDFVIYSHTPVFLLHTPGAACHCAMGEFLECRICGFPGLRLRNQSQRSTIPTANVCRGLPDASSARLHGSHSRRNRSLFMAPWPQSGVLHVLFSTWLKLRLVCYVVCSNSCLRN